MAIAFYSEDCTFLPTGRRKIAAWVKDTIAAEGYKAGDIAYIFCSPEYHLVMNRQYLGHDYRTDVITFDYSDCEGTRIISGDIFIDHAQVALQAAEWGAGADEELFRVMIHGVLHLCGYDDHTDDQRAAMRAKEDTCLTAYTQLHGTFKS
jgi:rRNA maturation RNase YbeY